MPSDAGADAITATTDSGPDAGPYDAIHFVGRFDFRDAAGPRFEWSGSSIVTHFHGTGIAIQLGEILFADGNGEHAEFRVTLDGASTSLLVLGNASQSYTLATGLPLGDHVVEIFRRSEALFGTVQFLGFEVEGGSLIASDYPFARRMEFIGDSITAGYGNEGDGSGAGCAFSASTENGAAAFGAVTAKNLDAAYSAVAWSGRGMRVNYGNAELPTIPDLYDLSRPTDPTSTWDFASYTPDVVVVHLGTNDTWSVADPGVDFTTVYAEFLARVRGYYPASEIFALASLDREGVVTRVQSAVNARSSAGDAKVHYVELPHYNLARDGVGCNGHPSTAAHQVMAGILTDAIRAVTNW